MPTYMSQYKQAYQSLAQQQTHTLANVQCVPSKPTGLNLGQEFNLLHMHLNIF